MPPQLMLEIELDLNLDDEGAALYRAYVADGMSKPRAARQVAQYLLGHTGGIVQGAHAVWF